MSHPVTDYRKKNGLTQAELAEQLGVSRSFVGLVEAGERQIDPVDVALWERVTGVSRKRLRPDVFGAAAA